MNPIKPSAISSRLLAIACALLTGCATKVWYQPGKTPAQAYQDLTHCRNAVRGPLGLWQSSTGRYVQECMRANGYIPTPAKTIPNGNQYPKP